MDTYIDESATQEKNSDLLYIEKVGVKILPNKIVADLDPRIQVNLRKFRPQRKPKVQKLWVPNFNKTGIHNTDFASSNRAKSLNGTQRENFRDTRMGYTHDFVRVRKTTACSIHIENSELETREVFEREREDIPQKLQTYLVNTLHDNALTQSPDSSKNEVRHETEVNPD